LISGSCTTFGKNIEIEREKKIMKWRVLMVACLVFLAFPSSALAGRLRPGDRVRVIKRGWWNPGCTGLLGGWWEFNNPTDYSFHCSCMDVPEEGMGLITPDGDGDWLYNRNYRVCVPGGCGWYPADALLVSMELPMVLKGGY